MIVYFDTSVLLKCYFKEEGSESAIKTWNDAHTRVGSVLLMTEMLATFARKRRESPNDAPSIDAQQDAFLKHWTTMDHISLMPALTPTLTRLHAAHSLRGADALHLAAALVYQLHAGEAIVFAYADKALIKAAEGEGMAIAE